MRDSVMCLEPAVTAVLGFSHSASNRRGWIARRSHGQTLRRDSAPGTALSISVLGQASRNLG